MATLSVVVANVAVQSSSGFSEIAVGIEVDLLIFETAPESFDEDVVNPPTLTIHADLDTVALEHAGERLGSELGPLVGIEDFRCAVLLQCRS